jgi:hypothetical protein
LDIEIGPNARRLYPIVRLAPDLTARVIGP